MEHTFALAAAGTHHGHRDRRAVGPTRMNNGNCDSRGRFYAGTMAPDECSPVGSLYRLDPDGAVEQILSDVTVSNGIDWSLDGETMFYVDSAAQSLDAFDFDVTAGRISNRRTVVRFSPDEGTPDGLTIDLGRVRVGGALGRVDQALTPRGELGRAVRLSAQNITSAAFGGELLDELDVTSAREGLRIRPWTRCRTPERSSAAGPESLEGHNTWYGG